MKTFKVGDKVSDTWYQEAGIGTITEVLKTRIKIKFPRAIDYGQQICCLFRNADDNGVVTYDKPHYQFLTHENYPSK